MGFDLIELSNAVEKHGRVARIVVAEAKGSAPRDAGTAMLVWKDGQSGTVGGGTLEFQAVSEARELLSSSGEWLRTLRPVSLGPALGQCCGGAVTLLTECYDQEAVSALKEMSGAKTSFARPAKSGAGPDSDIPHKRTDIQPSGFSGGWMNEEFEAYKTPLWIYGAGHVGRALVETMSELGFDITWVDTSQARFPKNYPRDVTPLIAQDPAKTVQYAPSDAQHIIVTYKHDMDLELCHQLLSHSFDFVGLIGSDTKWARFRKRLKSLGHLPAQIDRVTCPIGLPELGKSPKEISVGVAAQLLKSRASRATTSPNVKETAS